MVRFCVCVPPRRAPPFGARPTLAGIPVPSTQDSPLCPCGVEVPAITAGRECLHDDEERPTPSKAYDPVRGKWFWQERQDPVELTSQARDPLSGSCGSPAFRESASS